MNTVEEDRNYFFVTEKRANESEAKETKGRGVNY